MKELFLSSKNLGKLDILKELLFATEGVFIRKLTLTYDVSYSTKIRYIAELTEDLNTLFPSTDLSIKKWENTDLYFITNLQNLDVDYIIDHVRLTYIQESSLYPVVLEILSKDYSSANQLAQNLDISPSKTYASIVKINSVLELFNAQITLTTNRDNFSGNETGIRFATYFLLWSIFRTERFTQLFSYVPDSFLDITALKKSLAIKGKLTLYIETKLKIIQSISLYRIIFLDKHTDLPSSFYEEIELCYDPDFCFEPAIEQAIPADILIKEKKLIYFAILGLIDDLYTFEHKEAVVRKYQHSQLAIAKNLAIFLHNFENSFSLTFTYTNYIETYYTLLLTIFYAKYINVDFTDFYDVEPSVEKFKTLNPKYEHVENSLKTFILSQKELIILGIDLTDPKTLKQIIYLLSWSMYIAKKDHTLKIGIQISSNIYLGQAIKKTIADFIPQESFAFTTNPEHMDILISDTYEGNYPSISKYYFENHINPRTWSELIAFINQVRWNKKIDWEN